jgi:plasmid stability protein
MKTTLEIPDPLFRKLKTTAALQGRSMKEYVVEALTEKLQQVKREQGWRSAVGKLSAEGKKAAREVEVIIKAADFNKMDPEAWQ